MHEVLFEREGNVQFYTGLPNKACFDVITKKVQPHLKRKWVGKKKIISSVLLKNYGKKVGRHSKLSVKDELLTLMKLRLGLTEKDLSHRFQISQSTVSIHFQN